MAVERGTWQKERADHILEREAIAAEREQGRRERADRENRERQEEEGKGPLLFGKASTQCDMGPDSLRWLKFLLVWIL